MTVEASAVVDAAPDVVWALVTDIHLPTTLTAELEGAEWIDGDEQPRVGARFVVRTRSETLGSRETVATITQCEPRRVFEWAIGDPSRPISTWHVVVEPVGGATRLTLSMRSGTGDHRRDVAAFLEGIGGMATGGRVSELATGRRPSRAATPGT